MPRPKREWSPDYFYHIGSRGNRRDPLFRSHSDYKVFFHILDHVHEKTTFELASYCLMTNHYHLLMRSPEVSISKVMSLINKRYANYYNNRYDLSGHVFEKRFFDKRIVDPIGMIEVSRYIHLNPVEAAITRKPEDYPWSSFLLYKHPNTSLPRFMNLNYILDYYSGNEEEKRRKYYEDHFQTQTSQKKIIQ